MNFMPDRIGICLHNAMSIDVTRDRDYARVAAAIDYILARRGENMPLDDIAAHLDLSPFHFQRLFKRWAGVSPKQFMGYITAEHAKAVLESSASVLTAAFDVGLSGSSRLHDLFVAVHAMTPGEYKAQGRDLIVSYGFHETQFGRALLMTTERGICGMDFVGNGGDDAALRDAQARWPLSRFTADSKMTGAVVAGLASRKPGQELLLRGTNFQLQVWSALLRIPPGAIVSYSDIAAAIGAPKAVRAVGAALAANTVAYFVPCHRVLRATGLFKAYRWGAARRYAMLGWEAAQISA